MEDYLTTLDYLFSQLPMYQRVGKAAYKADLSNTHQLCKLLNHPEKKFKAVHVAGTNGKGSTSHMIASILQEAGYRVGLYTSPHLKDFRERIKINGEMISQEEVVCFVEEYKNDFEQINLSFFEWTVGLAFDYFAKQKVDIAVVETGLGGRLDSTNVIEPEVSVITNIGMDHVQFLGETLSAIANEKAGIIKRGIPVVVGETQEEVVPVFERKAHEMNTTICYADQEEQNSYECDLKGVYQQKNIKTAVSTIHVLQKKGWSISEQNIRNGLLSVVKHTGLLGRWQTLQRSPLVICDTGHNEEGVKEIVKQLSSLSYHSLHIVFGVVNDKSIDKVLDVLPKTANYYFCQANISRALAADELQSLAAKKSLDGGIYDSVEQAFEAAKQNASPSDVVFVGGSTFVVAEVV